MIVKNILSSNRSFAFAPRSGLNAVPSRPVARTMVRSRCRAPLRGLIAIRSRCGRARCPHRAAAPRRGAWLGIPRHCRAPWRGPVVVFLLLDLIADTPAHYPLRRDGDIAPYRHYAPSSRPVARFHCATRGPAPLRGLIAMRSRRGRRDVPIAPPRLGAVRGLASRAICRTPWSCPIAMRSRRAGPLPCAPCEPRGGSPPRCAACQVAHAECFAGASPCAPIAAQGAASVPNRARYARMRVTTRV